jgi:hypothetical protein
MSRLSKKLLLVSESEQQKPSMPSLIAAGPARPSLPVSVYGEDFAYTIRFPLRMRIRRKHIKILH